MLTNALMTTEAWKAKVQELSTIAQAKLDPSLHSSVQMAVAICLHNMIDLDEDGTCHVLSSDHQRWYTTNGACDCEAYHFAKGPARTCKHLLAKRLATKAAEFCTMPTAQTETGRNTPFEAPYSANFETSLPGATTDTPDAPTALPETKNGVSAPTHTEAPASVNCHISIAGRQVQLTLRDTDERRLLTRLAEVLKDYPMEQAALVQMPQVPVHPTPVCPTHGPMKESSKAKGTYFCPKKLYDGTYCPERFPKKPRNE